MCALLSPCYVIDAYMCYMKARVPEPWRLQLSMPHPCKFFLRLDTFQDTTVRFIRYNDVIIYYY